jgi:myo-inositol-1(or 4)-monophosphatase
MASADLDDRLDLASAVARDAGAMMLAALRNRTGVPVHIFKGQHDYLTETDSAVEQLIRKRIAATFPRDGFLGEESAGDTAAAFGRDVWVVDPIDGTSNFARGVPHFCTSIAFVRDQKIELGVIYQPVLDELYVARRGAGATRNGQPIRVSSTASMREAVVEAGWSMRRPTDAYIGLVDQLYRVGAQVCRAGSGSLGLAYVADGRNDAYCELHINSWDALAGLLLINEAGGWTNEFLANDGLRQGNAVLGCTPALKDVLAGAMGLKAQ